MNRNADTSAISSFEIQHSCANLWKALDEQTDIAVLYSVEEAVKRAKSLGDGKRETQIFVTGSLHLVGGVLSFLDGEEPESLA